MTKKNLFVKISDIAIRIDSEIDISRFNDIYFYKNFIVKDPEKYDCHLKVFIQSPPALRSVGRNFSPRGNWRISDFQDKRLIEIGPPPKRGASDNLSIFDNDYAHGESYQREAGEVFRGFLDQFLIINILSRKNGFLLHSSGINFHGKGLCFIGQSGAGKSTLLRLFRGEVEEKYLLNDDKLALKNDNGKWRVFGTPWHGEFPVASQEGADLEAIFFIKQSKNNYLTRLSAADTLTRFAAQVVIPLWDEGASGRVLESFHSLISNIPSFELGFLPNKSIVDLIKTKI